MFMGAKPAILAEVRRLTQSQPESDPLRVAVAFWGAGADELVDPSKRYRIICNLTEGGTNPAVIRMLLTCPNVEVRYLPGLHAKVFIGASQALVGSANFSANGLGIGAEPGAGWHEAAVLVDAVEVTTWFEAHWQSALPVAEQVLFEAELQFEARAVLQASGAGGAPVPDTHERPPVLVEAELFKSSITGGNKIRMAARYLENIYADAIEPETRRSVWNPAYAASIIWTAAGNKIQTRIDSCPYFTTPADVLARAKHAKTIEKVRRFIQVLSSHPATSPALRYWATEYLRTK
ncbi:hypothetical protein GCM10007421_37180 [Halopseudomonas oceani]|uniref:Phospholipase D-like domain-containing protein n=1 Tax=Halopseudomonas oceani TaxID=1708783 RepID=A0A2P4ESJ8_9GAMM|nr:phospholipase D family protein [Halopseudomonas oceani]POB02030.1 hypothetical protein C1949_14365 [Halopseudomonas oceani]GGE59148.1 hypothetical protein GCM10007421_37180 [Halopseudomonas oceani]